MAYTVQGAIIVAASTVCQWKNTAAKASVLATFAYAKLDYFLRKVISAAFAATCLWENRVSSKETPVLRFLHVRVEHL